MRTHDWHKSPLGTPERWPAHVRTAVALCLATPEPMALVSEEQLAGLVAASEVAGDDSPADEARHP